VQLDAPDGLLVEIAQVISARLRLVLDADGNGTMTTSEGETHKVHGFHVKGRTSFFRRADENHSLHSKWQTPQPATMIKMQYNRKGDRNRQHRQLQLCVPLVSIKSPWYGNQSKPHRQITLIDTGPSRMTTINLLQEQTTS
jgi:hypothetical protein